MNQPTEKNIKHWDERDGMLDSTKARQLPELQPPVLSTIPFMTQISLQQYQSDSHSVLSLLWADSSSPIISHGALQAALNQT